MALVPSSSNQREESTRYTHLVLLVNQLRLPIPEEFCGDKVNIAIQLALEGMRHRNPYWKGETGFQDPALELAINCRGVNSRNETIVRWLEGTAQGGNK